MFPIAHGLSVYFLAKNVTFFPVYLSYGHACEGLGKTFTHGTVAQLPEKQLPIEIRKSVSFVQLPRKNPN